MMDVVREEGLGKPVDQVTLNIDYEIIEHFSNHLYSSPNKAIEELVANGFDAFATWVYVFLPSSFTPEKVVVWDNGTSMGIAGLKNLWKIASSPKQEVADRVATDSNGRQRKLIGKFGIGKLASYTVGNAISHVCRTNERFYAVNIDYGDVTTSLRKAEPEDDVDPYRTNILEFSEYEARSLVASQFAEQPDNFDELFNSPSWTFAIISNLKRPDDLHRGRLSWILGNGMPLRPDFGVWVDSDPVTPKLERDGVEARWDFGSSEVEDSLQKIWRDAQKESEVGGDLSFGKKVGLDPNNPGLEISYIHFPSLGEVWGDLKLYRDTAVGWRAQEQGRSHGFFIMVRGRLINPEDDKMFLSEPSFGTFYRSQYVIHADRLDEDLLADRERLRGDTSRAKELTVLQRSMYSVTRAKQQEVNDAAAQAASPAQQLPTYSRQYYVEPLTALWMNRGPQGKLEFELHEPVVVRKALGKEAPMAELAADGTGFSVNNIHPYYQALEGRFGRGSNGQRVLREFEQLAIAEQLFIGYLYDLGLPNDKVNAIAEFRDHQYRLIAEGGSEKLPTLAARLIDASYKSGGVFENATVDVLKVMGFVARRDGKPGKKDILLAAPAGNASYRFTFEAKGKQSGEVANDEAELGGAVAHRDEAGAAHAVIVARKFAGFTNKDEPAILKECFAAKNVSIMEVDALIRLMYVIHKYIYPLDAVKHIFTIPEHPAEKMKRIEELDSPLEDFDYRWLLEEIWRRQDEKTSGRDVPYLDIYYDAFDGKINENELDIKLSALHALAYPLIQLDITRQRVALRQSPDMIATAVGRKLERTDTQVEQ